MNLQDKKILLAVSGSIAAYKTPELVRQFAKAGAEVQVIMTLAAQDLVSPLSLATVSGKPVLSDVHEQAVWNNHVALGHWADAMIVAPASAHTIARMAVGMCDNLLSAVYLSAKCPVFFAPAMDEDMWNHPATAKNVRELQERGHVMIPAEHGFLASGLTGMGRMAEPEHIVAFLQRYFADQPISPLKGKLVLVTGGPTYERIDPVRFIGNFSSGKMGIALANEFFTQGADVHLVLGPTPLSPRPGVQTTRVESAQEMFLACTEIFPSAEIGVLSAAVADYRPESPAGQKIKKQPEKEMNLRLVPNPDILATLGKKKKKNQFLVGFALETADELNNAEKKRRRKNADLIVLNSLRNAGAGFGYDTNQVTLLHDDGFEEYPLQSKEEVARTIVYFITQKKYVEKNN